VHLKTGSTSAWGGLLHHVSIDKLIYIIIVRTLHSIKRM